jgi:hypothetical protein
VQPRRRASSSAIANTRLPSRSRRSLFGQKEAVDPQLAHIAAAVEPADNLAGRRIGHEHRERP